MLLSTTFSLQLNLNKVLSKFFMPTVLKQPNALSWNDKQLACLSDKPDPRLVLAKTLHISDLPFTVNAP